MYFISGKAAFRLPRAVKSSTFMEMGRKSTQVQSWAYPPPSCGRASCDLCDHDDDPPRAPRAPSVRATAVKRTGEHLAMPEALARQDAAFDALPCY